MSLCIPWRRISASKVLPLPGATVKAGGERVRSEEPLTVAAVLMKFLPPLLDCSLLVPLFLILVKKKDFVLDWSLEGDCWASLAWAAVVCFSELRKSSKWKEMTGTSVCLACCLLSLPVF